MTIDWILHTTTTNKNKTKHTSTAINNRKHITTHLTKDLKENMKIFIKSY